MTEGTFLRSPLDQFVVCEDVRMEVGGKRILVGVYPGSIVVVPNAFPRNVVTKLWATLHASKAGALTGTLRVIRTDDGSVVFQDQMSVTVANVERFVPAVFHLVSNLTKSGRLQVQLQGAGDKDWLALGSFEVRVE
jgi:hypothetical protein